MKTAFVRLALLLSLLVSCAPVRDRRTLNEMEALMPERPDSALAVLQGLQPRDLPGLHVRPLHALLLSEALDKNYIDLTDDSLALAANHYYGEHGSRLHRLKSWYYLGRIRFNSGNYAEAVICYNKALDYAESLENYHYIGLINREIASAYSEVWDDYHATEHILKSINAFGVSGEERYFAFSRLTLAKLYYRQKLFEECEDILKTIERSSEDHYLLSRILEMRVHIMLMGDDVDMSLLSDYLSVSEPSIRSSVSFYSDLARAYQMLGKTDSSSVFLEKARDMVFSESDKTVYNHGVYSVEKIRGDYQEAIKLLEDLYHKQDSTVLSVLKQSVSSQQKNYYQIESRNYAAKAQSRLIYSGFIFTILFLALLFLVFVNKRQREVILNEIAQTAEVREDLSVMKSEKDNMKQVISLLFENRMRILQTLSDQYDSLMDSQLKKSRDKGMEPSRDEIISSFKDKMRDLRKDEDISMSMVETLNIWKDGIMDKFRTVFSQGQPDGLKMSKEDFELAPFLFSGMKQKTISYLTNYTEHSIKERKRRIRRKIEALDDSFSVEKRLFLDNL